MMLSLLFLVSTQAALLGSEPRQASKLDPIVLPSFSPEGIRLPLSESSAFPATAPFRTESWPVTFAIDVRGNQWAMLGASKTIKSGGQDWHLSVDSFLGWGGALSFHASPWTFETTFDEDYGVLTSADSLTIRTWGANIGIDLVGNEWERFSVLGGPLVLFPHLKLEENGAPVPGDLSRSAGFQFGVRYLRDLSEGRVDSAKFGFSAEFYFRYAPLFFDGDAGAHNKKIGGAGLVVMLGAYLRF